MTVDLVFGKYEIQHRLAIGGMGEVFYSLQRGVPGFERPVILKSLLPELAAQEGFIDQFLDEARVAATLNHPNVVSIFEVGQWNGTYYLAMEYIRGRNLAQILRKTIEQDLRIPVLVAVRIVRDAALGLDHAHRATDGTGSPLNIVHRDISPQNIMVRDDGLTKVVDFGIARASNRATRTATGALKGKLAYMAPEQVLAGDVGPWADQFALGVVLWELLTHRRLFKAERDIDVVKKVLEEPLLPPSTALSTIPAELDAVVMRMLERNATKRFSSCAEVAHALDTIASRVVARDQTPADFMRQLGTEDLVVKVKATPSQSGNFVISLKNAVPSAAMEEIAIHTGTPVVGVKATQRPPKNRRLPLMMAGVVLAAVIVSALVFTRPPPVEGTPPPDVQPPPVVVAPPPVVTPPPVPPEAPQLAHLVLVVPATAALRLDGKPLENAVVMAGVAQHTIEVTPDQAHYVQVEAPGFRRLEDTLTLASGEQRTHTYTLEREEQPARPAKPRPNATVEKDSFVTISSVPWSIVSLDGAPLGSVPTKKQRVTAGAHEIVFFNPELDIKETLTIQVKPGDDQKIIRKLKLP